MFSIDIEKLLEGMKNKNLKMAIIRIAEELERLDNEIKGLSVNADLF